MAPTDTPTGNVAERAVRRIDAFQQTHRPLAFPFAVVKKFGDDRGGQLAALMSYYAFLSLFPLLAAASTLLALALPDRPELRARVLDSALRNLPIVGPTLRSDGPALDGAGVALAVAIALAIWAGLGAVKAFEHACDTVWNVPYRRRPNFVGSLARSTGLLVVAGALIVAGAAAAAVAQVAPGILASVAAWTLSWAISVGGLLAAFALLTSASIGWRTHLPGALVGGTAWTVLLALGAAYVGWQVSGAGRIYGTFALVIGLLAWLFLSAQVVLLGAEVNVVRAERLWPRAAVQPPLTDADRRALVRYVEESARRPEVRVEAEVVPDQEGASGSPSSSGSSTRS